MIEPSDFAAMVRGASDEDLAAGLEANRELIMEGVFDAMPDAYLGGLEAVAEWRIDGERWQLRMAGAECSAERDGAAAPDVVYEIGGVDFLRLVAGQLDGPQLFVAGRLRVEGDLMLAARMPALFRPASPA